MANSIPPRVTRELLSDKVAYLLRRMILSGELQQGSHLVEGELAAQLGISRAPLREALDILGQEGLVDTRPGRGTYVRGFTAERVRELFAVRAVLESFAAELAAAGLSPEQCAQLQALVDDMQVAVEAGRIEDYVALDMRIHRAIWNASGNTRLVDVLERLVSPVEAFMLVNAEHYRDWPEVVRHHRQLVEAVASGQSTRAIETMRDHLEHAALKAQAALQPGEV